MKRLFSFIAILAVLSGVCGVAFAGAFDREDAKTVGYVNSKSVSSSSAVVSAPCYIYAVTVLASSANAVIGIYDSASAATGSAKVEIGEATQYASERQVFDPPLRMENGAYAQVSNGQVVIEYR
jgi:hypothetical protein